MCLQIVVDDENGPLGPGGTRALTTAIMGTGQDMRGGPYRSIRSLRLWRAYCGDEGARSIAEVLRLGGAEVQLEYLELFDDNIGTRGWVLDASSIDTTGRCIMNVVA